MRNIYIIIIIYDNKILQNIADKTHKRTAMCETS